MDKVSSGNYRIADIPKPSRWSVEIAPRFYITPSEKDKIPNLFWRTMQYLVLGFKWKEKR